MNANHCVPYLPSAFTAILICMTAKTWLYHEPLCQGTCVEVLSPPLTRLGDQGFPDAARLCLDGDFHFDLCHAELAFCQWSFRHRFLTFSLFDMVSDIQQLLRPVGLIRTHPSF